MNCPLSMKVIKFLVKNLPTKKNMGQAVFTGESCQTIKNAINLN